MMRIFDYCFYHVIRVNTDEMNLPAFVYVLSAIGSAGPMFFLVVGLLVWLPIFPQDMDSEYFGNYYIFLGICIPVLFIKRYNSKMYKKLVERWGDKAKTTKGKLLGLAFTFLSISIGLISMWLRFN